MGTANLDAMSKAVAYRQAICAQVSASLRLPDQEGPLIDFGAGKGEYGQALGLRTREHVSIYCVEPDSALHKHSAGMVYCSQVGEVPLGAAAAYSLNVFEHIPNDTGSLTALALRVRAGGRLFILVPAHPSLWTPMDDAVGHKRRYTAQSLRELAVRAGLELEDEGWFDRTGYIATRLLQGLTRIGLHSSKWNGLLSTNQVRRFDAVFGVLEPILAGLRLPFGKNRWILVRVPAGSA